MKFSDLRARMHLQLTPERKRHLITLAVGLAVSWTLASLMACASAAKTSAPLYQQLGGVSGITQFTDRAMDRAATDLRTKRTFEHIKMKALKESVAAYVCKVADGPCHYEGVSMKQAHADLGITGSEFDVLVSTLREEINRADVPQAAKNELLRRLAPSRRDIVKQS